MDKESLIKARGIIIDALEQGNIENNQDVCELIINLWHFLEPQEYENSIKTLRLVKRRPYDQEKFYTGDNRD